MPCQRKCKMVRCGLFVDVKGCAGQRQFQTLSKVLRKEKKKTLVAASPGQW